MQTVRIDPAQKPFQAGSVRNATPTMPTISANHRGKQRILMIGDSKECHALAANVNRTARRHAVIGCLRLTNRERTPDMPRPAVPIFGNLTELEKFLKYSPLKPTILLMAESEIRHHQFLTLLDVSRRFGVELWSVAHLADAIIGTLRFFNFYGHPVVRLNNRLHIDPVKMVVKNVVDFLLALTGVILTLPIMAVTALLVRLTSPGPALFRQERVGKDSKTFHVMKFRSMRIDAETTSGPMLSVLNDNRMTPLGRILRKTHIDELPQLFNVLNGTMSLVGPRPERPYFVERFVRYIPFYRDRLVVKPGITGLAQVYGSYHSKAEEKLIFDLNYINSFNVWLDIKVCVRTVWEALHSVWQKE